MRDLIRGVNPDQLDFHEGQTPCRPNIAKIDKGPKKESGTYTDAVIKPYYLEEEIRQ